LTFDSEGNLYGTAYGGGAGTQCATGNLVGCGVVFELSPPALQGGIWNYSLLYSFGVGTLSDGVLPIADLIFDQLGNLYGTTADGGANEIGGVVFELSPPGISGGVWTEAALYSFEAIYGGSGPHAGVIFDKNGNLVGTTYLVGAYGTAFELMPAGGGLWTEKDLYGFGGHATLPQGDLLIDSGGNIYGTTSDDALFELQRGVTEVQLNLYRNGGPSAPSAGLIFGKWDEIYGTSLFGGGARASCGRRGCGTVFAVTQ
jgi:hypothetical protein